MAIIKHNNQSISNVTAFPSAVPTGKPVLLSTATASSSSSIEFTSGIDSTYDIYKFVYTAIHPQTDATDFQINFSSDGGSNYNVTKTTTNFRAFLFEDNSANALQYYTPGDLAQSTSFQELADRQDSQDDSCCVGNIFLFSPSNTTYVKHFIVTANRIYGGDPTNASVNDFIAGYCNTTSVIDAVKFQMSSGNIDAGTIKMYGISA